MLLKKTIFALCTFGIIIFIFTVIVDVYEENQMLCYIQSLKGKTIPSDFEVVLSNTYDAEVGSNTIRRTRLFGKIIRTFGFSSSVIIGFENRNGIFSIYTCVYLPSLKVRKL